MKTPSSPAADHWDDNSERPDKLRTAILSYLDAVDSFVPARDIAKAIGRPYKSVIDALSALHNRALIVRQGKKFSARWGRQPQAKSGAGLTLLESYWFGKRNGG